MVYINVIDLKSNKIIKKDKIKYDDVYYYLIHNLNKNVSIKLYSNNNNFTYIIKDDQFKIIIKCITSNIFYTVYNDIFLFNGITLY